MRNSSLRTITLTVSLMLIASAFIVGCAPQQRPNNERLGTRYDLGAGNNYYGTGMRDNMNNRYETRLDDYGPLNRQDMGMDRRNVGMDRRDRLYGFFDTDNAPRNMGDNNIPRGMATETRTATNSNEVREMENSCRKINGVTDATIVKNGDTAYVGCNTTPGTNENIAALRTQCANRIRNIDPSIKKVVVTVDDNKVTRLRNMVRDMNIGRPARGFMTDLENLFR